MSATPQDRSAIDQLLETAQASLDRVQPADLAAALEAGAWLIDTRPSEQRQRDGERVGGFQALSAHDAEDHR